MFRLINIRERSIAKTSLMMSYIVFRDYISQHIQQIILVYSENYITILPGVRGHGGKFVVRDSAKCFKPISTFW